jgi:CRP/FNR family transcriptional regulator, cyclic AMP receptor protein
MPASLSFPLPADPVEPFVSVATAPQAFAPVAGRRAAVADAAMVQAVRQVPLLATLPDDLIELLAQRAQVRRCARGDLLLEQDGLDAWVYVLRHGRAHVERTGPNGRSVLLDVLEPGALVGELSLIDGQPHNASVRCVQACEVLVLRGSDLLLCQAQAPAFSMAWACALVGRLRDMNQRITSMSLDGVRDRVWWQLTRWSAADAAGHRVVSGRIGRNELARMVGASREMVCRVMRGLQAAGRIELRPDRSILLHLGTGD